MKYQYSVWLLLNTLGSWSMKNDLEHAREFCMWLAHYNAVIMGTMASQITSLLDCFTSHVGEPAGVWNRLPVSRLFTQAFIQAQIKENIKAPRHWPLWGEFTSHRWIPRTKGQ